MDFGRTVGSKEEGGARSAGVGELEGFMQHSDPVVSHCTFWSKVVIFLFPFLLYNALLGGGGVP